MAAKPTPSRSLFVVRVKDKDSQAVARQLNAVGSLEEVKGRADVRLLRVGDETSDARDAWQKAQQAAGPHAAVQPVLLDQDGKTQLPTGEVTVRFRTALSDKDLDAFARAHGLRLVRRNEFAPEQAVFDVVEPARYLPDVVDELSESKDTRQAWANTLAAYERQ
jgi:hypothetical protein